MTIAKIAAKIRGLQRTERRLVGELELTRTEISIAARLLEAEEEAERQTKAAAKLTLERQRAARAEERVAAEREKKRSAQAQVELAAAAIAASASSHFNRKITSPALLDQHGGRRVEVARTALIWLASNKFGLSNLLIADVLGRDPSAITRRIRVLTLTEAAIVRGAILILAPVHPEIGSSP